MSSEAGVTSEGKRATPNIVLIARRQAKGWGRERLAREFERLGRLLDLPTPELSAMTKAIYRHETGRAAVRDEVYIRLYCAAFETNSHDLFGTLSGDVQADGSCGLTSHKFVPVYLGSELLPVLIEAARLAPGAVQWAGCHVGQVEHPAGVCTLYAFPWGVGVFHLAEDLSVPNIASLAVWRRQTYRDARQWATDWLREATGSEIPVAHYVLSAYWVHEPPWRGRELTIALRLLSMPRVLLDRGTDDAGPSLHHAELVEQALLRDGFHDGRIDEFGVGGLSIGCASWAGLSYYPQAPGRALQVSDLIECELLVQALWSYCHHVHEQVEQGHDPVVPAEYGWRWVRAVRSRLTVTRPQETAQHASMRSAVLETSELGKHLTTALELLRDVDGE
ncbi:hypothetical protein SAMN04488074_109300 [Lentzea albidocapillata subsp. violacea]|uniref:Uncharacterized protein n=1 Tax=Lentzea albidocapillata subsp. violacea TaxID=128104 RepID=A0A1G9I8Y0_9PSEU|nr:hypothetical protein [Lentzea albidocapillata]SDL21698.1 hypothetical protein SAMN04488074_109300 [Lentzea albidocapillata subsp. violacea]